MSTLKPCRSPYCECEKGKCTHPGCYDARGEAVIEEKGPKLICTDGHELDHESQKIVKSLRTSLEVSQYSTKLLHTEVARLRDLLSATRALNTRMGLGDETTKEVG